MPRRVPGRHPHGPLHRAAHPHQPGRRGTVRPGQPRGHPAHLPLSREHGGVLPVHLRGLRPGGALPDAGLRGLGPGPGHAELGTRPFAYPGGALDRGKVLDPGELKDIQDWGRYKDVGRRRHPLADPARHPRRQGRLLHPRHRAQRLRPLFREARGLPATWWTGSSASS